MPNFRSLARSYRIYSYQPGGTFFVFFSGSLFRIDSNNGNIYRKEEELDREQRDVYQFTVMVSSVLSLTYSKIIKFRHSNYSAILSKYTSTDCFFGDFASG